MINYYLLTKPGIILGNLIPFSAGFLLASRGAPFNFTVFFATLLGLAFIMASACVFNNYIDRSLDQKMKRTKDRALVTGLISGRNAILFAIFLGIVGNLLLLMYVNLLTVCVAAFGFFVYVVLYSQWKSRTIYGTAIGSIAGAVPPVIGYCAVSNQFDVGALIFFFMMVLWQMPHFFAIATYHFDDYSAAKIPVLPVMRGMQRTKIHMVIYIVAFILATASLTYFNYTGYLYLAIGTFFSTLWLLLSMQGFKRNDHELWGRNMFRFSLITISAICMVIPFDTL